MGFETPKTKGFHELYCCNNNAELKIQPSKKFQLEVNDR